MIILTHFIASVYVNVMTGYDQLDSDLFGWVRSVLIKERKTNKLFMFVSCVCHVRMLFDFINTSFIKTSSFTLLCYIDTI